MEGRRSSREGCKERHGESKCSRAGRGEGRCEGEARGECIIKVTPLNPTRTANAPGHENAEEKLILR